MENRTRENLIGELFSALLKIISVEIIAFALWIWVIAAKYTITPSDPPWFVKIKLVSSGIALIVVLLDKTVWDISKRTFINKFYPTLLELLKEDLRKGEKNDSGKHSDSN